MFTGQSGAKYGYDDERTEDRVFFYTREGREGYMSFSRGDRAIGDYAKDGEGLHPFEKGKGGDYTRLGVTSPALLGSTAAARIALGTSDGSSCST